MIVPWFMLWYGKRTMHLFAGTFLLLCLLPWRLLAFDELSKQVQTITLRNGMRWLLLYRPQLPVFSGIVLARVGGADEVEGKTGLAHMFEHMAFKGSKDIGAAIQNEVSEILTRKGAVDLNAFTSKDVTGYHASMPKNQFPLWAYITSEMIFQPALREFYQERDVVMEERRLRYDNSPQGTLMEALLTTAFPSGPYHTPPIGEFKDLQGLTVEDAEQFHRRFYLPQNMVGVLAGAIPKEQARSVLERFFGRFPSEKKEKETTLSSFSFQGEKRKEISFPAEPYLTIAFHKPNAPARDDYVFDMIDGLLCEGRTSRLYRRLVEEKKMVSQVSCSSTFPGVRFENLYVIFLSPNQGRSLKKIEEEVRGVLESVKQEVQEKELKKVLASVLYHYYWALEDNLAIAEHLAMTEALLGDWHYLVNYPKVLKTITPEEIQVVAKKYFVENNQTVVTRVRGKR